MSWETIAYTDCLLSR